MGATDGATRSISGGQLRARDDCLTSSWIICNRSLTRISLTTAGESSTPEEEAARANDREGPEDDDEWTRGIGPDVDAPTEEAAKDAPPREWPRMAQPGARPPAPLLKLLGITRLHHRRSSTRATQNQTELWYAHKTTLLTACVTVECNDREWPHAY